MISHKDELFTLVEGCHNILKWDIEIPNIALSTLASMQQWTTIPKT